MPTISNIAGACQHYRLPYPMTREALSRLFTAVLLAHPEAREVCLAASPTCSSCVHFSGQCKFTTGRHRWKPEVPPTENTPCRDCPQWEAKETVYLLNISNKDTTFDIEASYGNRHQDAAPEHPRPEA